LGSTFDGAAYKIYLDDVLSRCSDPADPIERMLLEQLALAHHALGRLHVRAAEARSLPEAQLYHASAARLLGEFRLTALALKTYRMSGESTGRVSASPRPGNPSQEALAENAGVEAAKADPRPPYQRTGVNNGSATASSDRDLLDAAGSDFIEARAAGLEVAA
jgi:hypothetical protein